MKCMINHCRAKKKNRLARARQNNITLVLLYLIGASVPPENRLYSRTGRRRSFYCAHGRSVKSLRVCILQSRTVATANHRRCVMSAYTCI